MRVERVWKPAVALLVFCQCPLAIAADAKFDMPACGQLDSQSAGVTLPAVKLPASKSASQTSKATIDQASAVNALPLAIMPSARELKDTDKLTTEAECQQIEDLWSATIERSPNIHFVIDRLQPTSDQKHDVAQMTKVIGGLLSGVSNLGGMMLPSGIGRTGVSAGSALLQSLFNSKASSSQLSTQISKEELVMLYNTIRETADKLVLNYRQYRKAHDMLSRATQSLEEAQSLANALDEGSKVQQYLVDFTLRSARRDVDGAKMDLHIAEQQLADLAGVDAVDKLDREVAAEETQLRYLVGGSDVLTPPLKLQEERTAASTKR